MRENRTSGLTSGVWKQGTKRRVRHRQPKGSATDGLLLHYCATSRLYTPIGGLTPAGCSEFSDVLPHFSDQSLDDLFEHTINRPIDGIRVIAKEEAG